MTHLRKTIDSLINFLQPLLGLANCHMVDYFTRNVYETVPQHIRNEINVLGFENVINLLLKSNHLTLPPNLSNFIENSEKLSLKNCGVALNNDEFTNFLSNKGINLEKYKLKVFMSHKKSHEVEKMSTIVAAIKNLSKTDILIDIGDGKGYLSSFLALYYEIPTLGVDASEINTIGAEKRVKKLGKVWQGLPDNPLKSVPKKGVNFSTETNLYKQITKFVHENTDFKKIVSEKFPELTPNLGVVGLHTCGNLAANSLKIFNKNRDFKSIVNVGCCYHLLDEHENGGFPLSKYLRERNIKMGRSARMIASQSVDRILSKKELPNVSIFYRSLLQVLIESQGKLTESHVGKFRKPCTDFVDYSRKASKRLEINLDLSDDEINKFYLDYKNRRDELNVFYLIRSKLAPIVESLILLDRLLYLFEEGHENSFLVQLFDPVISPRCYAVISIKNQ